MGGRPSSARFRFFRSRRFSRSSRFSSWTRSRSPDKFASIWIEDQKSRKGTYMAIGGSKKTCETFPLYPDVCMRMSKSNFYFFKPPEIKKHHHHGGGDDDDSDDDEDGDDDEEESDEEEEMSDHDAELDQDEEPHHRILIKYRGPTVKQQTEIVVEGKTTIGTDDACDIVLEDDEMDEHHCTIELDEKSGVFYVVDHDSKNGTYVKLTEKSPFELNYSDVIRLGDSRLHFKHATRLTILSTIDNLFIQAAMFMFQINDVEMANKKLEPLGTTTIWNRFKAYRKKAGKRNDPPIDEKGWKCVTAKENKDLFKIKK